MQGVILAVIEHPEMAGRVLTAAQRLEELIGKCPNRGAGDSNAAGCRHPAQRGGVDRKHELQIREREQARITALKAAFDQWMETAQESGVSAEWADVEGLANSVIQEWGRRSDVIVLKRRAYRIMCRVGRESMPRYSRPIGPSRRAPEQPSSMFGRHVAIAWRHDQNSRSRPYWRPYGSSLVPSGSTFSARCTPGFAAAARP